MITVSQPTARFAELADEPLPSTLEQARLWLERYTPQPGATLAEQGHFHALAAEVYKRITLTDPADKDRAGQWAQAEHDQAEHLYAQMAVRDALAFYLGPDFDHVDLGRTRGAS